MSDEKLIKDRRGTGPWKKYGGYGLTAFLVIAGAVLLTFILLRIDAFSETLATIKRALTPVIIGIIIAYILNPLMVFIENGLKHVVLKRAKRINRAKKFCRGISLILTLIIFVGALTLFLYMLVPKISETIAGTEEQKGLVDTIPEQADNLREWVEGKLSGNTKLSQLARDTFDSITEKLEDFVSFTFEGFGFVHSTENEGMTEPGDDTGDIKKSITPGSASEHKDSSSETADEERTNKSWNTLTNIMKVLWDAFGVVYDIVIGIIFSIYILLAKDTFGAHAKKIVFSLFKRRKANAIIRITKQCHKKFTGAITGKIVDSIIVGVICYIGMMILKLPYKELISVIVAVTNIVPFFGPYIGGVPCIFLVMCDGFANDNLWPTLYFVVFLVLLQQFDCNILDPKIVGGSIGLPAFWVLFACVVYGSLFGLPGMLLGVPSMACIYMIIKEIAEYRLKKKGLDPDTQYYMTVDSVDVQEFVVVDNHPETQTMTVDEYEEKMKREAVVQEEDDEQSEKTES